MSLIRMVQNGVEYRAIKDFYGDRVAQRSQVPLMNHIDQGMLILETIGSTADAMAGFCLHPLFQNDNELTTVGMSYSLFLRPVRPVVLAMEYRRVANAYLAHCDTSNIVLSTIKEVNDMLVADKVQNRKDFIRYHKGTHANSARLDQYFKDWMNALGISEMEYARLVGLL
jgi:hypothetical protein